MADICVLGLGYVGLPTACLLANAGFHVVGVDIDPDIVETLRSGKARLGEAGLATLVSAAVNSGNLVASLSPEPSDAFIICVPTPIGPDKRPDMGAVEAASRAVLPHLRRGNLVILESTSPVGTTRELVGRILAGSGLIPGQDFDLCYCPERVLPGNTVNELVQNDRVIGGVDQRSAEHARTFYERFCQGKPMLTDDRTAELVKLMENTYRDVNVALANAFAGIAERAQVDVWKAIELANLHPRVQILGPGPGVGGHCIPVDPWFLITGYPEGTALLRTARETNDGQAGHILARMRATGLLQPGHRLAVLGAAYKPDVDEPRESPALLLAEAAHAQGIEPILHDPLVRGGERLGFAFTSDLGSCLKGAAAAALVTGHRAYRGLSSKVFLEHMTGRLIYDSRNWLNHASLRLAGFRVLVTGVGE